MTILDLLYRTFIRLATCVSVISPLTINFEEFAIILIYVWTEPLCLNLLGPGNSHGTYLDRLCDLVPKTCPGLS